MPFGVRNPFTAPTKGAVVNHPENYDSCPVCERRLNHPTGLFAVALCIMNQTAEEKLTQTTKTGVFACCTCYSKHMRLQFFSIDEFKFHMIEKKAVRGANAEVKKARAERSAVRKSRNKVQTDLNDLKSVYESLGVIYRALGRLVAGQGDVPGSPEPTPEVPEQSLEAVYESPDDDDDILAGMTDEQRARMDEAVARASARTSEVPQEVPRDW